MKSKLNQIQAFLAGKKTYLIGASMVLAGLANQDYTLVQEGLAVMFLRAGIEKI